MSDNHQLQGYTAVPDGAVESPERFRGRQRARFLLPVSVGYLLAPMFVSLTTWILYRIGVFVSTLDRSPTRPFGIGYLLSIWALTVLAGRGPGALTLVLSVFAIDVVLIPPAFSFAVPHGRDAVELAVFFLVGSILIFAQDAYQHYQQLRLDLLQREALVNKLSASIRSTLDPEHVPEVAVKALGEVLDVDRCFFSVHDLRSKQIHVGADWHRPDLQSLAGDYRRSDLLLTPEEFYRGGQVRIIRDVRKSGLSPVLMNALKSARVLSGIGVPVFSKGELVATLTVAMADEPRDWTPDEVAIVSSIAAMTQSALELARAHHREAKIAEVLQSALHPPPPLEIAALDLSSFYQACLDEASVGGDFSDVFAIDKGTVALVVGDLSGKGLLAATQVATVRNMLRYVLYTECDLAEAISRLNVVLSSSEMITGFATLFAGVYNTGSLTLRYVSCGQEPGLVRRASTGAVELLEPTGPILGLHESADYVARDVSLNWGDAFVLFTDGLTESGPDRANMFGLSGMIDIVQESAAGTAEQLMTDIVTAAQNHSGDFSDDICLLTGIVKHAA